MAIIRYPISANYMAHWSPREAIRELLQNAIDSGAYTIEDHQGGVIISNEITSPISVDNLTLLGETTKLDGSTIGKFGEGFKLALLVLARAQIPHAVTIGSCKIVGMIKENKFVMWLSGELPEAQTKMVVVIEHPDMYDLACSLLARKADFEVVETTVNAKAMTPGGVLFVGGLKVCEGTGMKYSYDLPASAVQLERDRNTVRSFELAWASSKFWAEQQVTEELVQMIFDNVPDVQYINSNSPSKELLDAVYDHYLKFYGPNTILAESKEKAKAFEHLYQRVVYAGGGSYYSMVTSNKAYHSDIREAKRVRPADAVTTFIDENIKHMRSRAKRAAKKLKLTAAHW